VLDDLAASVPPVEADAATTPEPTQRLPPAARGYFMLEALGWAAPLAIASLVAGGALRSTEVPSILITALQVLGPLIALVGVTAMPRLRYRHWRYELRDEELDLLRGALVITRTLIPMVRVQHVDTRRTWLGDQVGVQAVIVHTAAGSHTIPALEPHAATAIRDRIALLARTPDEL
jgi:membrane protein YdbS with pleckstrin-like domain